MQDIKSIRELCTDLTGLILAKMVDELDYMGYTGAAPLLCCRFFSVIHSVQLSHCLTRRSLCFAVSCHDFENLQPQTYSPLWLGMGNFGLCSPRLGSLADCN
jgi:hypothetical protein